MSKTPSYIAVALEDYWTEHYKDKNGNCILCSYEARFRNGVKGIIKELNNKLVYCICEAGIMLREKAMLDIKDS